MVRGDHSDLEVVPPSEALETQKFPYYSPEPVPANPHYNDTHKIAYNDVHEQDHPRKICGVRKRTFWILLLVAIIVVAAAVGGGVGGALASRSSNSTSSSSNNNAPASQQPSSAPPSSSSATPTSATPSITTTTIAGPTSTILRDCPSSNNTIYAVSFGSTSQLFRKACSISYLNSNGIDNVVGGVTTTMDDCINKCAQYNVNNRTEIQSGNGRICNAVCWRNTYDKINDWAGGQCFGFTTVNITVGGETAWNYRTPTETRCDSAGLMN